MKKAYEKPALFAEAFQLATNIAVSCNGYTSGIATHNNRSDCGYYLGTQTVFNRGVPACQLPIDAAEYGEDCYNGPFLDVSGEPFGSM